MLKNRALRILLVIFGLILLAGLVYWIPPVHNRLSWRVDFALAYLRGVIDPVEPVPTALPAKQISSAPTLLASEATSTATSQPTPVLTVEYTPTPLPSPTPLPELISLAAPAYEKQDINNCGPAALTMYLRYYGWEGDQTAISDLLKPNRKDRNVNVEELAYYVRTRAGWLNIEYRVGGDMDLLKKLLAAGIPVMVEESFFFEEAYWPDDDPDSNRQYALDIAQMETETEPENAYAWFNLGTNLVYFERYLEAAGAYDKARELGLPQRMFRYQFGPFIAYFHTGQIDELIALTDYAIKITPNAEEAWLWHGWAMYRQGDNRQAIEDFEKALSENPNYLDAQYALDFVRNN